MSSRNSIVIVADAHIQEGAAGKSEDFFRMLDHFLKARHDIVFLGDVFELWIALKGYETEMHERFVQWCAEAKTRRSIGFIEGNHEYFVSSDRSGAFTWTSEKEVLGENGALFAHGDLINAKDRQYRLMRALFKSGLAKGLLKAFSSAGPSIAEKLRVSLKSTNMEHRKGIPGAMLESYAEECGRRGAKKVFVGHFHEKGFHRSKSGVELHIVPSWRDAGTVATLEPDTGKTEFKRWQEVW